MATSLPALAGGLLPHPELMTRFREAFLYRKRENIAAALRRGIQRGDLPRPRHRSRPGPLGRHHPLPAAHDRLPPRHRPRRTPRPTRHQHPPTAPSTARPTCWPWRPGPRSDHW
ncbi:hypothetical protein [Streptomyces sp. NPDC097610]|uniref:hypothetical protein n=1 Tax=Streptomyces sp. NPDC097610 TaxID=3157227 RepID=UPI003327EE59